MALLVLTSPHQPASAQGLHWTPLGEPGTGGWVVGMRFSSLDSRKILVTGDMLGVGLSEDGGASWQSTTGFKSWEMGDATWSPTQPNVAWVGAMSGPYVWTDGGHRWTLRRDGMSAPAGDGESSRTGKKRQSSENLRAFTRRPSFARAFRGREDGKL